MILGQYLLYELRHNGNLNDSIDSSIDQTIPIAEMSHALTSMASSD